MQWRGFTNYNSVSKREFPVACNMKGNLRSTNLPIRELNNPPGCWKEMWDTSSTTRSTIFNFLTVAMTKLSLQRGMVLILVCVTHGPLPHTKKHTPCSKNQNNKSSAVSEVNLDYLKMDHAQLTDSCTYYNKKENLDQTEAPWSMVCSIGGPNVHQLHTANVSMHKTTAHYYLQSTGKKISTFTWEENDEQQKPDLSCWQITLQPLFSGEKRILYSPFFQGRQKWFFFQADFAVFWVSLKWK